ncbi:MAG: preprotein translocase subunit SecA, partial [Bacteroidota bacterium]
MFLVLEFTTLSIMLDFISKSLGKIFGTKYDRDVAAYSPIVEEINREFERLKGLSNDELRNRTLDFKTQIAEHLAGIDEDIANITRQSSEEQDLTLREDMFREIDKLKEERDKHLEDILKQILP